MLFMFSLAGASVYLKSRTGNIYFNTTGSTRMTITNESYVGIGTTDTGTYKLNVSGNTNIMGITNISGLVTIGTDSANTSNMLTVKGTATAKQFSTGDLLFNHNNKLVWRMYEDENGLYAESPITGKKYKMMMEELPQ